MLTGKKLVVVLDRIWEPILAENRAKWQEMATRGFPTTLVIVAVTIESVFTLIYILYFNRKRTSREKGVGSCRANSCVNRADYYEVLVFYVSSAAINSLSSLSVKI